MVASVLGFYHRVDRVGKEMTLENAQRSFIERATILYTTAESLGAPIRFHIYYRGPDEQDELFNSGVSKAKAYESPHQYGLAADFHFANYGWDVPASWWNWIDDMARQIGLETGVFWNDGNHLQLQGWTQWKYGYFRRLWA